MATIYPPFATPAEVAEWMGHNPGDPKLQPAIDAATAEIRAYCGWHVSPTVADELVLDGPGGHVVTLPSLHVVDVSAVTVDPHDGSDPVLYDSTGYEWSPFGELRRYPDFWSSRYRAIAVTLEHGYPSGSSAAAVCKSLCIAVASRAVLSPASGVVREQTLVSSITYGQAYPGVSGGAVLMPHELSALGPYKLRGV